MPTFGPRPHVLRAVIAAARAAGFTVHEVAGWETRGRPYDFRPIGVFRHHTASAPGSAAAASLNTCLNGRPLDGIPGPLCQLLLGRDASLWVLAAGAANHAGLGNWSTLNAASRGIPPTGDAVTAGDTVLNWLAWGIEVENDGRGEPYSQRLLDLLVLCEAEIERAEGWVDLQGTVAANRGIHHRESTSRKIDMSHRGDVRARVAEYLADEYDEEFDMLLFVATRTAVPETLSAVLATIGTGRVAMSGSVADAKRQRRRPVVAVGLAAANLLARDVGEPWTTLAKAGVGVHTQGTATFIRGNSWSHTAKLLIDHVEQWAAKTPVG